jgi:thiol-disulfide isomerase/thioredoxin
MKSSPPLVLLVCALTLPWFAAAGELLRFDPAPAPALSLPDLSGEQHNLNTYRGQVVLVNFWASWCPPCLAEMPSMERLSHSLAGQPFRILAVNTQESRSRVWKFRKLLDISFPTLLDSDGDVTRAWDVEIFPTSYLIDADGQVRYRARGALEWDSPEMLALIEELLPDRHNADTVARDQVSP